MSRSMIVGSYKASSIIQRIIDSERVVDFAAGLNLLVMNCSEQHSTYLQVSAAQTSEVILATSPLTCSVIAGSEGSPS